MTIKYFYDFILIYVFKKGVANHFDNNKLRPRNINWHFRRLQSQLSKSQCNVQRLTCCGRHRNHWIETPIFKLIYFYIIYVLLSNKFIYKCIIIESNVLHRFVSYWESLSWNNFLYSVCTQKWIETQLLKGNLNPMFSTTSATS